MSLEVREHNASALGRAIFFSCVVPSLISAPAFSFQHCFAVTAQIALSMVGSVEIR